MWPTWTLTHHLAHTPTPACANPLLTTWHLPPLGTHSGVGGILLLLLYILMIVVIFNPYFFSPDKPYAKSLCWLQLTAPPPPPPDAAPSIQLLSRGHSAGFLFMLGRERHPRDPGPGPGASSRTQRDTILLTPIQQQQRRHVRRGCGGPCGRLRRWGCPAGGGGCAAAQVRCCGGPCGWLHRWGCPAGVGGCATAEVRGLGARGQVYWGAS